MSTLELFSVSKRYGDVQAVHELSLEVHAQATTVLLGPSGCGKSTLLQIMMGLVKPDSGSVILFGSDQRELSMREQRHKMGYVIQEGGLFPHLTARRNVALVAEHLGWSADRIEDRLRKLSTLVDLDYDRLGEYPHHFSGGQRQRLSLMRALMLDPPLLLLDEPLGALDPLIRADLQQDLREIAQDLHKTVVLVTHDIAEATYLGDHLVLMKEGQIMQQGSPEELIRHPAHPFVERFIQAQRQAWEGDLWR